MSNGVAATAGRDGFRCDINGLRAWAVVAVVLFHFGVPGFSGGFVGVDVFFVISGFLMAGIVIGDLEGGRFSLPGFYMARARRIVPALLVVVLAVLVVGWFILMPSDYQMLGRHARESVFFTSNLRYLAEAGYFDSASHEKWLLHTWSLSVEWQFYLVYPLVLMALQRFLPGRRNLVLVHLLILGLSLALSAVLVAREPSRAFFLLPARAWELLLGGLVFLLADRVRLTDGVRHALECMGVGLILLSMLFINASLPWPGLLALVPTLGAVLVLVAARQGSLWMASPPAQWLGTRSYSIYLWHWPLMVWLTYFGREGELIWIGGAILLSLTFGHVSYHVVEVPTRRWLSRRSELRSFGWVLVCVVLVAVSAQLVRRSGIPERLPAEVAKVESERHNRNPRLKECLKAEASCVYRGERVSALVIGDSHADALVAAVADALPGAGDGVYFKGESGCLFVYGAHWAGKGERADCKRLLDDVGGSVGTLYPGKPLFLINRTTSYVRGELPGTDGKPRAPMVYFSRKVEQPDEEYFAEFRQHYLDTMCLLAEHHPLYLLRPVPEMHVEVPRAMGRALLRGRVEEVRISRDEYRQRHAVVWAVQDEAAERCGAKILDPLPYLCDEQYCYGSKDGMPLYVDDDHLSELGNRLLVPMFAKALSDTQLASAAPAPVESAGR